MNTLKLKTKKHLTNLIKNGAHFNLSNMIAQTIWTEDKGWQKVEINEGLKTELSAMVADMLGGWKRTQSDIRLNLSNGYCRSYGIYERVNFQVCNNKLTCNYCAGQDYASETQTIRNLLK